MKCLDSLLIEEMQREDFLDILFENNDCIDVFIDDDDIEDDDIFDSEIDDNDYEEYWVMDDMIFEQYIGILDDAVDEELDAIDDLMSGPDGFDFIVGDIIPDSLVDGAGDGIDSDKYLDAYEDYPEGR